MKAGLDELLSPALSLETIFSELKEMRVRATDNPAALAEEFGKARALAERASQIEADSILDLANARSAAKAVKDAYQDAYDAVVERHRAKLLDRSWEERSSIYRTSLVDELILLRQSEKALARCEAWREAIHVLCLAVYRARGDLDSFASTVRASRFVDHNA